VNVESEGEGEGSDVTHPGGAKFAGEKRGGVRGEEKRDALARGEGEEAGVETVSVEKGVQRVEMSVEARLKGRTGEKSVVFVTRGEGAMWSVTVEVWKVGGRGGVEMVSRERAALTAETEEGGGPRFR
jgi:hypothetical protein